MWCVILGRGLSSCQSICSWWDLLKNLFLGHGWINVEGNFPVVNMRGSPAGVTTCTEIGHFLLRFLTTLTPSPFTRLWSPIFRPITIRIERRNRIFSDMQQSCVCYFTVDLHHCHMTARWLHRLWKIQQNSSTFFRLKSKWSGQTHGWEALQVEGVTFLV